MISYKGYSAEVDYDEDAEVFYGTVNNINAIMAFRGSSVAELKQSFADVVETYLEECRRTGMQPEKPFSGKITLRVTPELHRKLAIKAASARESMNRYIEDLILQNVAAGDG